MKSIKVSAYKSPKKEELFLYVEKGQEIDALPNELLVMFGEPQWVIDFTLDANRKMPRANPEEVIKMIERKKYYLQMPPTEVEKMGFMPAPPDKLDNIF